LRRQAKVFVNGVAGKVHRFETAVLRNRAYSASVTPGGDGGLLVSPSSSRSRARVFVDRSLVSVHSMPVVMNWMT